MEVYMMQKITEDIDGCEYDTHEELFYTWEDANEYMEALFEEEIRILTSMYCDGADDDLEDYCEITERYNHKSIYMEDSFWMAFNIEKKIIMSFA